MLNFDDFILRVDYISFFFLRRFLEFFRVFKYNEYINYNAYHLYNDVKEIRTCFMYITSFIEYKDAFFQHKFMFFKRMTDLMKFKAPFIMVKNVDYLKIPYIKILILFSGMPYLYTVIKAYFLYYISSYIYAGIYKGLLNQSQVMQMFDVFHIKEMEEYLYRKKFFYILNTYAFNRFNIYIKNNYI